LIVRPVHAIRDIARGLVSVMFVFFISLTIRLSDSAPMSSQ